MIYITDISGVFAGGKINPDAKDVISKLKENDKLVILSDDGNLTMNTETLILFTGMGNKIAIEKCVSPQMAIFVIGKYSGSGDTVRVISKNSDLVKSLDFLKGSDSVQFGWKSSSKKKASNAGRKARTVKKDAPKEDSFMEFEAAKEPAEEEKAVGKQSKSKVRVTKKAGSSDFMDLSVESVLGIDCSTLNKAGIHQIKDLYVYDRSRKRWADILTPEGYDLITTKLSAFGQPGLKEFR